MATLNEAEAAQAFRSALAVLGNDPERSAIGVGYDLQRIYRATLPDINLSTWRAVGRRAAAAVEAAQEMERDAGLVIPRADLPQIPGATLNPERFTYRVLVRVADAEGHSADTVIDYRTDAAVSKAQIEADLSARFAPSMGSRPSTRRELMELGSGQTVSVSILAAGRR